MATAQPTPRIIPALAGAPGVPAFGGSSPPLLRRKTELAGLLWWGGSPLRNALWHGSARTSQVRASVQRFSGF